MKSTEVQTVATEDVQLLRLQRTYPLSMLLTFNKCDIC